MKDEKHPKIQEIEDQWKMDFADYLVFVNYFLN